MITHLDASLDVNAAGHLEIDGCDALELVERFGAPLWVIAERTIRANAGRLREAFAAEHPRTRIVYASKANPEPAILAIARSEGCWADAVTMGHLRLLRRAGYGPGEIVFNGNAKTEAELRWALEQQVGVINVDSAEELQAIAGLQPPEAVPVAVCLRVATDPARHADDPAFAADEAGSKFGMTEGQVLEAAQLIQQHPALEFAGVHHHHGFSAYGLPYSGKLDLRRHERAAEQVVELAGRLRDEGFPCRIVNLGGGFRVPKAHGFGPGGVTDIPEVGEYARVVAGTVARAVRDGRLHEGTELYLEAGGYLVSDAVVLLASVLRRKGAIGGGADWMFVEDTSAYHFVRALMYGFRHHVLAASKAAEAPTERVRIGGPVCTTDSLAEDVDVPHLEAGDVIAVLDQGAYCEAVTSDYCAIPIPAAVLASEGRAAAVRRRETVEDLVARFDVPGWLDGGRA